MRLKALAITVAVLITAAASISSDVRAGRSPKAKVAATGQVLTPPTSEADPTSPSVGLRRVVSELERLTAGSEDRALLQALVSARSAADRWAAVDRPDVPAAVADIGSTSQALLDSEMRNPEIDELRGHLAEIARHIAVNINDVVGRGPEGESGRRSITAGDELATDGDAEGAINAYLNASQDFALLTFHMPTFRSNLEEALSGKVNAAAWALAKDGEIDHAFSFGFGQARHPIDFPPAEFFEHEQMNIASVSKNVTATAVMKLLAGNPFVGLDDVVHPFLPPDWQLGTTLENVTFRDLLTHQSGIAEHANPSDSFDSMRLEVASFDLPEDGFTYQNINFGLFRVIIPWLWTKDLPAWEADYFAAKDKPKFVAARYQQYIQEEVLALVDVFGPQCGPEGDVVLAYTFPYDLNPGRRADDFAFCGGGGWHFSPEELTRFVAQRQFTDKVLSDQSKKVMKKDFLGYMDPANGYGFGEGAFGTYYGHGGDLGFATATIGDVWFGTPPKVALHTCMLEFPNAIHASLFLNSNTAPGVPYQCAVLKKAYEDAWIIL
jgi:D-alanyl-D-alanine carboxypeptidase